MAAMRVLDNICTKICEIIYLREVFMQKVETLEHHTAKTIKKSVTII